jgi:hypothetical protein
MTALALVALLCSNAGTAASPQDYPQEFGAFIRSEIEKWGGVMKFTGMKKEAF